ncbi:DUF2339 domain-containing protein [Sphingomonas sp.]|uniref:DUF2339 domain-containing protein n=1 Tax=Sphingomonas sp. TaxID=28214 RepID=UPI003D6D58A8
MTALLFIALVAAGIAIALLFDRVARLERWARALQKRLTELDSDITAPPPKPDPQTDPLPATVVRAQARPAPPPPTILAPPEPVEPVVPPAAAPAPSPPAPPERPMREPVRLGFEAIVGGKLPIWIGGAALVLSAFFLVRFSIENGLLGPVARTIIATLFGVGLIAASEVARRIPATRDDPRIGQALAGAGVAILYGTLYIAAALYNLIGDLTAFILMIGVTVAALGLALRHGPPTAIMALIGGFTAPLIAGFESAGIGPLLAYLGLLVAALFGLAIRRGWVWLALAACGGGFAWVNLLIATLGAKDLAGVGAFVLLLAIGATLALPRTGAARPWLRLLPLVAGLVQLLVLAPALDFGPLAWGLYLLLSAAALWLGWRDEALAPGAAAALGLVLLLLAVGLDRHSATAPIAAIAITALFAIPGHLRARSNWLWAGIALGGTAGPVLLACAIGHPLLVPMGWAALLALAAGACASLSWRDRSNARAERSFLPALTGGAALAAILSMVALVELLPIPWRWPAWLAVGLALAAWAQRSKDGGIALLAPIAVAATGLAVLAGFGDLGDYFGSVIDTDPLPPIADLIAIGLLPPLLLFGIARLLPRDKTAVGIEWIAFLLALAFVPAVLPAPWHAAGLGLAALATIAARLPRNKALAALAAVVAAMLPVLAKLLELIGLSLGGEALPYTLLPTIMTLLREMTMPAALIAGGLFLRRDALDIARQGVIAALAVAAVATLYALAKQPLAIATLPRFEAVGFLERAILTQAILATAWALRMRQPRLSEALLWFGLARFAWFDLALFNPLFVTQTVGSLPLLNLATIHVGLIAAWLWLMKDDRRWRIATLGLIALAVALTVRQATHGAVLTGDIGRTENWLYSAALLGLSLVWLARGIQSGAGDLRVAGLALLTLVTLKVFLIDASALAGILRILSFLGLGIALIGIGWAYGRVIGKAKAASDPAEA